MKLSSVWVVVLTSAGAMFGQNIVGSWQGALQAVQNRPPLRLVVKIARSGDESLRATFYSIDQGGQPIQASAISQQGTRLKMTIAAIGGDFDGRLGADGNSIEGTWAQGGQPLPLKLERATPASAWSIPEPPPPRKLMAANANPSFEVATIKPSRPDAPGRSILVGRGGTNLLTTTSTPVADLISMAFDLHPNQIMGGPSWLETEKYDISAKPDQEGVPNLEQLHAMIEKLLKDRFQLAFHREKKELSVYVITLAKGGPKLAVSQLKGNLPGFGGRGPGSLGAVNATIAEFAGFLQARILDRPVVDQTGLTERYDFQLRWTRDNAQAATAAANAPIIAADSADAPPDLFAAIQQQLGLKLESKKAAADVLVIDHIERPSDN